MLIITLLAWFTYLNAAPAPPAVLEHHMNIEPVVYDFYWNVLNDEILHPSICFNESSL